VLWCGAFGSTTAASSGLPTSTEVSAISPATPATHAAPSAGGAVADSGGPNSTASDLGPLPPVYSIARSTADRSSGEVAGRPSNAARTFVALGDSLTAWAFAPGSTSPGTNGVWPSVLEGQESSLILLKNAGIPGNTTSQMLARLERDVLAYSPDVLFLMGGTNDIGLDMSIPNAIGNIRQIVETAKTDGITVVLMTVPPVNDDYNYRMANRAEYNADLASLASQEGILLVDVFSALATPDGSLASAYSAFDGLHLSQQGEQAVAQAVCRALHPPVPPEPE
jgi:lysophospholipase L1-like esterase